MNSDNYVSVGVCPICGQGRQLIARENETGRLYIFCEDCESEWLSPESASQTGAASRDVFGKSTFLNSEEIAGHPWQAYLK